MEFIRRDSKVDMIFLIVIVRQLLLFKVLWNSTERKWLKFFPKLLKDVLLNIPINLIKIGSRNYWPQVFLGYWCTWLCWSFRCHFRQSTFKHCWFLQYSCNEWSQIFWSEYASFVLLESIKFVVSYQKSISKALFGPMYASDASPFGIWEFHYSIHFQLSQLKNFIHQTRREGIIHFSWCFRHCRQTIFNHFGPYFQIKTVEKMCENHFLIKKGKWFIILFEIII